MPQVGNVWVDVGARADSFNRGVDQATGRLNRFSGAIDGMSQRLGMASLALGALTAGLTIQFNKAVDAAKRWESGLTGLGAVATAKGEDFDEVKEALEGVISDGLVPMGEAANALKSLLAAGLGLERSINLFNALKDSAAFNRQGMLSMGQAIEGAAQGIKNQNSIMVDNAGITKNLSIMYKDYAREIGTSAGKLTELQKTTAAYIGIMKEAQLFAGNAAQAMYTYSGASSMLEAQLDKTAATIGKSLLPMMGKWRAMSTELLRITQQIAEEYPKAFGTTLAAITGLAGLLAGVAGTAYTIQKLKDIFPMMGKLIRGVLLAPVKLLAKGLNLVTGGLLAIRIGGMAAFGWITVIVAIAGALFVLYRRSESVRRILDSVGETGREVFQFLIDAVRAFSDSIIEMADYLGRTLEDTRWWQAMFGDPVVEQILKSELALKGATSRLVAQVVLFTDKLKAGAATQKEYDRLLKTITGTIRIFGVEAKEARSAIDVAEGIITKESYDRTVSRIRQIREELVELGREVEEPDVSTIERSIDQYRKLAARAQSQMKRAMEAINNETAKGNKELVEVLREEFKKLQNAFAYNTNLMMRAEARLVEVQEKGVRSYVAGVREKRAELVKELDQLRKSAVAYENLTDTERRAAVSAKERVLQIEAHIVRLGAQETALKEIEEAIKAVGMAQAIYGKSVATASSFQKQLQKELRKAEGALLTLDERIKLSITDLFVQAEALDSARQSAAEMGGEFDSNTEVMFQASAAAKVLADKLRDLSDRLKKAEKTVAFRKGLEKLTNELEKQAERLKERMDLDVLPKIKSAAWTSLTRKLKIVTESHQREVRIIDRKIAKYREAGNVELAAAEKAARAQILRLRGHERELVIRTAVIDLMQEMVGVAETEARKLAEARGEGVEEAERRITEIRDRLNELEPLLRKQPELWDKITAAVNRATGAMRETVRVQKQVELLEKLKETTQDITALLEEQASDMKNAMIGLAQQMDPIIAKEMLLTDEAERKVESLNKILIATRKAREELEDSGAFASDLEGYTKAIAENDEEQLKIVKALNKLYSVQEAQLKGIALQASDITRNVTESMTELYKIITKYQKADKKLTEEQKRQIRNIRRMLTLRKRELDIIRQELMARGATLEEATELYEAGLKRAYSNSARELTRVLTEAADQFEEDFGKSVKEGLWEGFTTSNWDSLFKTLLDPLRKRAKAMFEDSLEGVVKGFAELFGYETKEDIPVPEAGIDLGDILNVFKKGGEQGGKSLFKSFSDEFGNKMPGEVKGLWDKISGWLGGLFGKGAPAVPGMAGMPGAGVGDIGGLGGILGKLGMGGAGGVGGLLGSLGGIAGGLVGMVGMAGIGTILNRLAERADELMAPLNKIAEPFVRVADALIDALIPVIEAIAEILEPIAELIAAFFEVLVAILNPLLKVLAAVLKMIAKLIKLILGPIIKLLQGLAKLLNKIFGVSGKGEIPEVIVNIETLPMEKKREVESVQRVRGIIAGETQIPIYQIGERLKEAMSETNVILREIRDNTLSLKDGSLVRGPSIENLRAGTAQTPMSSVSEASLRQLIGSAVEYYMRKAVMTTTPLAGT